MQPTTQKRTHTMGKQTGSLDKPIECSSISNRQRLGRQRNPTAVPWASNKGPNFHRFAGLQSRKWQSTDASRSKPINQERTGCRACGERYAALNGREEHQNRFEKSQSKRWRPVHVHAQTQRKKDISSEAKISSEPIRCSLQPLTKRQDADPENKTQPQRRKPHGQNRRRPPTASRILRAERIFPW